MLFACCAWFGQLVQWCSWTTNASNCLYRPRKRARSQQRRWRQSCAQSARARSSGRFRMTASPFGLAPQERYGLCATLSRARESNKHQMKRYKVLSTCCKTPAVLPMQLAFWFELEWIDLHRGVDGLYVVCFHVLYLSVKSAQACWGEADSKQVCWKKTALFRNNREPCIFVMLTCASCFTFQLNGHCSSMLHQLIVSVDFFCCGPYSGFYQNCSFIALFWVGFGVASILHLKGVKNMDQSHYWVNLASKGVLAHKSEMALSAVCVADQEGWVRRILQADLQGVPRAHVSHTLQRGGHHRVYSHAVCARNGSLWAAGQTCFSILNTLQCHISTYVIV